jgi:phage gpG-like protein
MTPRQFQQNLSRWQRDIDNAVSQVLPVEVGNKAVELFRENFDKQGFFGEPWKGVSAATENRRTFKGKPVLQQSGDLARSFHIRPENGKVTVESDLVYSAIHNEGGKAGRGHKVSIPQRQFMGDHPKLREEINKVIETGLNNIFNS